MVTQSDRQEILLRDQEHLTGTRSTSSDLDDLSSKPKGGFDFGPALRTIRRNLLLIAGIGLIVTLPAILSAMRAPRIYQGSFRLLVEPVTSQGRTSDPSAISRAQTSIDSNSVDYPTLLQVLQSPELLTRIARQVQSRYPDVTADVLMGEIFSKNLIVQRVGGNDYFSAARLIEVIYKGRDPQQVQFILEEFSKAYLRYGLEDRRTRIGGGVQFIEDQLPALQKRVNSLEAQLQTLKQRYRLTDPVNEGSAISKQLQDAQTQRMQTQRDLAEQQALYRRLQSQLQLTPNEALVAASLSENSRYQELLGEIKKVESQIAIKSARFNPDSPVLRTLLEQRSNLVQLFEAETQQNLGQRLISNSSNPQILTFQNPLRVELIRQLVAASNTTQLLQIRSQAVEQTERLLDQKIQQFPVIVRQYNDLQQQLEISTKTLNQFLTQRETLRIEAAQKEEPWERIAPPKLAMDASGNPIPAATDVSKKLIMQLAIGLFLGVSAAFLRERLTNVFYSSDDLQSATKAPLLGVIPFNQNLSQPIAPIAATHEGAFTRAFGSFYANLRFLAPKPIQTVVISSAGVDEGKTTVALYLAHTATSMGQKVLLVDANLHSPQLHTLLDIPNARGISELLMDDQLEWQSLIQRSTLGKNFSILTAGQGSVETAGLIASPRMQRLMDQLQEHFDLVIYDTPNLIDFLDTTFLATHTDGVVLVASIGKVKCPKVKQSVKGLQKFRIPLLGVVANQIGGKHTRPSQNQERPYAHLYGERATALENLKTFPNQ